MNVFIIDDEQANREILQILITKHFPDITLIGESENISYFLESTHLQEKTDLLFLDILMPNSTGFDLLTKIENRSFEVILVTGFDEFALQAFEHSVIDYVLKPIDKDRLIDAIQKAIKRLEEKNLLQSVQHLVDSRMKIAVIKNKKTHYIECSLIAYIVGQSGGYSTIYCKNGESFTIAKTLSNLELECQDAPSLKRVNKSTIINLDDISTCDQGGAGYISLNTNDFEIFLPRRKKREVFQQIEQYLLNKQ